MIGVEHIEAWRGQQVLDPAGEQLGKLDEIFLDQGSGTPILAAVKSGLLGRHSTLIPIEDATVGRDYLRVAHAKSVVDNAPQSKTDGAPDAGELDALGAAYGLRFSDRIALESSRDAEARRAEAQAARDRAEQLAREAEEKIAARDDAHERAQSSSEEALRAEREADEARQAALRAREEAQRHDDG